MAQHVPHLLLAVVKHDDDIWHRVFAIYILHFKHYVEK